MKVLLHKGFSAILALLVLFSTVSFTIEKHFCGDVLVDVSIFTEVEKCAMEAYEIALEKITKIPCCKDKIDVVKGQDELKMSSFDDLDLEQQRFIIVYTYSYTNLLEYLQKEIIPHKDYSPPNLVTNIQVLDQVFII
ncbi:hypothetical protein A8C32_08680 [Flavivirga aquatica]|uniref:Uncharacterized protein n=1 Tax=Flavivirga aquatica TaxID=1849968 RepID=A0A1E5SK54_9FLAO|nr:hypothetical protein A8C32_08680 [Flavivirga aquatica]